MFQSYSFDQGVSEKIYDAANCSRELQVYVTYYYSQIDVLWEQ